MVQVLKGVLKVTPIKLDIYDYRSNIDKYPSNYDEYYIEVFNSIMFLNLENFYNHGRDCRENNTITINNTIDVIYKITDNCCSAKEWKNRQKYIEAIIKRFGKDVIIETSHPTYGCGGTTYHYYLNPDKINII